MQAGYLLLVSDRTPHFEFRSEPADSCRPSWWRWRWMVWWCCCEWLGWVWGWGGAGREAIRPPSLSYIEQDLLEVQVSRHGKGLYLIQRVLCCSESIQSELLVSSLLPLSTLSSSTGEASRCYPGISPGSFLNLSELICSSSAMTESS